MQWSYDNMMEKFVEMPVNLAGVVNLAEPPSSNRTLKPNKTQFPKCKKPPLSLTRALDTWWPGAEPNHRYKDFQSTAGLDEFLYGCRLQPSAPWAA
jgi:hypothetical protein